MEYNLDFADLCFSREETEPCVNLEGWDNLKKRGFNKGWAQNNWMPSAFAELLVQASA